MVNKATERLKEIEIRMKEITNKGSKSGSLLLKEASEMERLIIQKQGILLGLKEGRKEVFERIMKFQNTERKATFGCIVLSNEEYQKLKQEMGVEK